MQSPVKELVIGVTSPSKARVSAGKGNVGKAESGQRCPALANDDTPHMSSVEKERWVLKKIEGTAYSAVISLCSLSNGVQSRSQ